MNTPPEILDRRADSTAWRATVDNRLDIGAATMAKLSEDLRANTKATNQVRLDTGELVSLLRSFQGAFKVFNMIGKVAKPLGYIVMAISACIAWWAAIKGLVSTK